MNVGTPLQPRLVSDDAYKADVHVSIALVLVSAACQWKHPLPAGAKQTLTATRLVLRKVTVARFAHPMRPLHLARNGSLGSC